MSAAASVTLESGRADRWAWDRVGPRVVLSLATAQAWDEAAGHPFRGNQYAGGESGGAGKPKTIAQFAKQKLSEGHSPAKVAEMAQKEFGSKTTAASVAWYKSQMNKEAKAKGEGAKPGALASLQQKASAPVTVTKAPKPGSIEAIVQQYAPTPVDAHNKEVAAANKEVAKRFKDVMKKAGTPEHAAAEQAYQDALAKQSALAQKGAQLAASPKPLSAEHALLQATQEKNDRWTALMAQKFGTPEHAAAEAAYKDALEKQAAAQKAAFQQPAAPAKAPVGTLQEKDYVGGKAYYKMTPAEKEQAAAKAQAIIKSPDKHTDAEQLAAQMFAAHHEKQLAAQKEQSAKEAASLAAAKEAAKPLSAPSSPLTSKEYDAAKAYTGNSYVNMNHLSRSGTLDQHPAMAAKVKALDSAIAKSTLEKDLTLYRGIPASAAKSMFPGGVVQTGQVVSDKGFSSTSLRQEVAHNFSKGVVLHINAPKGSKALDVRHLSQHSGEDEVVLPRDAKLRVVGVLVSDSTKDYLHVRCDYVA